MTLADLRKVFKGKNLMETDEVSFFISEDDVPQVINSVKKGGTSGLISLEFDKMEVIESGNGSIAVDLKLSDGDKKFWKEVE